MRETELLTLYDLLKKIRTAKTTEESQRLIDEYTENIGTDSDGISDVLQEIKEIATELITLRQRNMPSDSRQKLIEMSEKQQQEFAEAERILVNNLLNYHFQPIVSAKNGSIISYEALMRPISDICPSPYHIVKYAELANRLDDVKLQPLKTS